MIDAILNTHLRQKISKTFICLKFSIEFTFVFAYLTFSGTQYIYCKYLLSKYTRDIFHYCQKNYIKTCAFFCNVYKLYYHLTIFISPGKNPEYNHLGAVPPNCALQSNFFFCMILVFYSPEIPDVNPGCTTSKQNS